MASLLFYSDAYPNIERQIQDFLNTLKPFLTRATVKSTRATGDAIQDVLATHFQSIVGETHCLNYSSLTARRAMADLAFEDADARYYVVDVQTHLRKFWEKKPD